MKFNQIIHGDCLNIMHQIPNETVDLVVTSPPYWGLRDYGEETVAVWDENPNCSHEWNSYQWKQHSGRG